MKILYIDCGMGAAGDMLTGALLELLPEEEQEKMIDRLNHLGLGGVSVRREKTRKCGITGSHMEVSIGGMVEDREDASKHEKEHDHEHHHSHISDIERIIGSLDLTDKVKQDVIAVYKLIAEAESIVHGENVSEIHFHEVGMKDAIMDVSAVCMLMERLSPDRIVASPVHVGSGTVKCAHGIMPVPAPATACILRNIPIYSTELKGELCTPTGAALLRYYVDDFGPMPVIKTDNIGYGMGTRDFPTANCLRVIMGDDKDDNGDKTVGLACNIDDMTGEELGFATEKLYEAGAKEVYTIPVGMKKSRPGIMLEVLCDPKNKENIIRTVFKHTTTIGLRETEYRRYILDRKEEYRDTEYGRVRVKRSEGFGVVREKAEYEDIAALADEKNISLRDIRKKL